MIRNLVKLRIISGWQGRRDGGEQGHQAFRLGEVVLNLLQGPVLGLRYKEEGEQQPQGRDRCIQPEHPVVLNFYQQIRIAEISQENESKAAASSTACSIGPVE